jgi:bisphosphoglycerate-dependent phosphoglycerate mutase
VGEEEAVEAGEVLAARGFKFDVAFTSRLGRASKTARLALQNVPGNRVCVPQTPEERLALGIHKSSDPLQRLLPPPSFPSVGSAVKLIHATSLNERHYGILQGLKKDDPDLLNLYGETDLFEWRKSYSGRPPPIVAGHPFWQPPPAPLTESLEDCQVRVDSYYNREIRPYLTAGATVFVVAHANTIRALVKTIDSISDEDIRGLRIPNSIPLVYRLHPETLEPVAESGWLVG